MEELKKAKEENDSLKNGLKQFQDLDPEEMEKLKAESQVWYQIFNKAFVLKTLFD